MSDCSFGKENFASTTPSVSVQSAISIAETALGGSFNGHPPAIEFFAMPSGEAVLTHVIQVENEATGAWFEAFVDAHASTLVSVTNFVTQASVRDFFPDSISQSS